MDTLCTVWAPGAVHGYWFKAEPRPEEFFAQYHAQFIEQIFTGEADPPLPGWPETPWVGRSSVARTTIHWADGETVATYKAAFANPGSQAAAITYYRDALAFSRVLPKHNFDESESYEALSSQQVAEIWETGLEKHPLAAEFMDYGPEDRLKRYPQPAVDVRGPQQSPGAGHDLERESVLRPVPGLFPRPASGARTRRWALLPGGSGRLHERAPPYFPSGEGTLADQLPPTCDALDVETDEGSIGECMVVVRGVLGA